MREAVIVAAVRTPVGKFRGGLSTIQPHKLAGIVVKEAVRRAKVNPAKIDEVIYGSVMGKEYNNIARVVTLEAGLPIEVPGVTLDRQCGTSLNGLAYGALLIQNGQYDCVVAGGVEMDSRKPWILERVEQALQMMPPRFLQPIVVNEDYENLPMIRTAENLARKYNITRDELDQFSVESHKKALEAWSKNSFDEQIVPIEVISKKETRIVDKDEIMRESTLESLGKLKPASGLKDGVCTAGNSSPTCDGASAVVVMEKEMALSLGCEILGTFRGFASAGVDPDIMGIGPVAAVNKLMDKINMSLEQIDLIEMNEAFAAQSIACIKELNMDTSKLNVNGGAIALGHPLAATGGILTCKLVYEMKRRNSRFGLITFCCGGGQGVAALIER